MVKKRITIGMVVLVTALLLPLNGNNSSYLARDSNNNGYSGACNFSKIPGAVWWSTHCAPAFWFSLDEPALEDSVGKGLRIPVALPFEEKPDAPVVYYQCNRIYRRTNSDGSAYISTTFGVFLKTKLVDISTNGRYFDSFVHLSETFYSFIFHSTYLN